jgi:mannan endo-1,4-beta-mannosidase
MRLIIAIICLLYALVASAEERSDASVTVTGSSFTVDGKPFFVAGVNNYYLPYGTENEVIRVLDDAVALGANVVRTFLTPVIGTPDDEHTTIWQFHNTHADSSNLNVHGSFLLYWDNKANQMAINEARNGMPKIDFLIAEAKKRHLKLIIAFLDFWDFTGGIQQMAAWYGAGKTNYFFSSRHMRDDHFFFTDPKTIRDYQRWVEYVVNRMNPQTGLRYRDDPTIMAWELANEATAKPDQLRLQWTLEMAAYTKQQDPNHLVASGGDNLDVTRFDISIPAIDFGTWHGYPKYRGINVDEFDRLIRQYCNAAVVYKKPVLLEEFGLARSNPNQAAAYKKWLNTISEERNCAGWLVWRLVSRQENGRYPDDKVDEFDVRNDGGPLWSLLQGEIQRGLEAREQKLD